ncbi:MAG: hypothetical protein HW405_813 [Candidatus Berkelbacteria bacterium]|nr:hypothetical protein [Candidatus Berkelbacteria bacterium]
MVNFNFENIYKNYELFIHGPKIDLAKVTFIDPWGIALLCLNIAENHTKPGFDFILPKDIDALHYLKRTHLDRFLEELGLIKYARLFDAVQINERENLNVHEIYHCPTQDIFGARLNKFYMMFEHCGLDDGQAGYMTGILGEIGNNVFDHNLGNWPIDVTGAIIVGQAYPKKHELEIIVADPGIGFKQSLRRKDPNLKNQIEAIELALKEGVSGRIEEKRGNGLKCVQDWTFNELSGMIKIQSYDGLVIASKKELRSQTVPAILGTIVGVKISY